LGLVISLWGESTPTLQRVKAQIYALIFGKGTVDPPPRRCPNNPSHIWDPNWAVCQYCEDERRAKEESEKRGGGILPNPVPGGTRIGPPGGKSDISGGDTRRIVGVVITYTWRPQGQLFPIYEGKNFIGRADVSDEALPRPCDIQIPEDTQMSAEHALILYRHGDCDMSDPDATN